MNGLVRNSQKFIKRNASTILTVIGGVGVVSSTILAAKASPKAIVLLEEAKREKGDELTLLDKFKVAGPVYIPTVVSGVTTLACIFGANMLNKRQQAALVSAYALLDSSYKDYKKKTTELFGEDADSQIKEEIAKDKYEETNLKDDEVLFYDCFSERYFKSTMMKVSQAEYNVNRDIHMRGWAELNEFYEYLDIDDFDKYEAFGWAEGGNYEMYWQAWVDFNHNKITMDDGTECISIMFLQEPYVGYEDY